MRHHLVDGVEVAFTQAEEDAADVRVAEREASRPTDVWQRNMEATDKELPRWFEDAVTERSVILKPGRVKDNYDEKVRLRGTKP